MKPADDLSKDARALLRAARGGDDITAAERQRVLQAFRERARLDAAVEPDVRAREMAALAPRSSGAPAARSRHGRALPRPVRRVAWTLAAAIATGSLAAFAREGGFDGWGAAIEKMLGRLAGGSSTTGVEPASSYEPERTSSPAGDGLPSAAVGGPERHGPEPGHDDSGQSAADAATQPAARAAPASARSNASGRRPPPASPARSRRDRETGRAHFSGAAQLGVSGPPSAAAASREPAREASVEPSASHVSAPTPDPSASDELGLIITARNALAARRHADARAAAERHARQFPRGAFVEEREAILALCECRETGASERARAFIERRPDSLFSERIRQDCKLVSNLVPGAPPAGTH